MSSGVFIGTAKLEKNLAGYPNLESMLELVPTVVDALASHLELRHHRLKLVNQILSGSDELVRLKTVSSGSLLNKK